jgi:hypothetical protein
MGEGNGVSLSEAGNAAFSQPLVFDQPEDDLDNEFIIKELVEIFRGIKKFRQAIFVTHNANLVVNADAEQVIVAENHDGLLKCLPGSLEHEETNQAIRRILEGGDEVSKRREMRFREVMVTFGRVTARF